LINGKCSLCGNEVSATLVYHELS